MTCYTAQQGGLCLILGVWSRRPLKGHRTGKMLVPIIDDANLMHPECLRKLRLLFEDFPRTHNLVLIGHPPLLQTLSLTINEEIRSRVTF